MDIRKLSYSKPGACTPRLLTFDRLQSAPEYDGPDLPSDCTAEGAFWCATLPVPVSETLYLHVYKGTPLPVHLRVYGIRGGKAHSLSECLRITQVARRVEVGVGTGKFDFLLVRFSLRERVADSNFVKLAAYDGREPTSPGGITVAVRPECGDTREKNERKRRELPFSCDGKAVQRLILASCSPEDDLVAWGKETGLEFSESYRGKAGSVVALGVEQGLDLNTTGGAAEEVRAEVNAGAGMVSADYIINLFDPESPGRKDGEVRQGRDDKELQRAYASPEEYLANLLDGETCSVPFDRNTPPVIVTIIDSGVDYSSANVRRWEANRYRQREETEFVRPWRLGYDFIHHDYEPDDETPHGTYVAAALQAQYRAKRPLELIHMKAFGAEGISTYFGALVSIYEATTLGSQVINMSWGFYQEEPPEALYCAIRTAADRGVYLVASAGNDGKDLEKTPQWPAAFAPRFPENLLTVASYWTGESGEPGSSRDVDLKDFSNFGDEEATLAAFMTTGVPQYRTGKLVFPLGTSISTPIVSGLLAHWLADHPGGSLAEFVDALFEHADSITDRITKGHYLPLKETRMIS